MSKKILYLDMDGVIADFDAAIKFYDPSLHTCFDLPDIEARTIRVNEICEKNPDIFEVLPTIRGAIPAVKELFHIYDVYFLSTPMWNVPESFKGKRIWLEQKFGNDAYKRLILTHRKDLNIGHYLVDDTLRNGVSEFKGHHIHFGTEKFKDWDVVLEFLKKFN